jgi:hypothetical protein
MSVKKAAAARVSKQREVEAPAQSVAARREAEAEIRALVAMHAPAHPRLVDSTRKWLQARLPTAHEIVYEYRDCFVISYAPNEHGYEGVFALRASLKGVSLYLNQGKGLPDPAKLLKGTGKQVRFIDLDSASTLARPEVACLIDAALGRNPMPYPSAGRGSVIIRSTAAKQRRPAQSTVRT